MHNLKITLATGSNEPTTITFDAATTSHIRLTMTSPSPGSAAGFLRIAELQAVTA